MAAPHPGGDDPQPPRADLLDRTEVRALLDRCGFKWWCWPSYLNVRELARELGGEDPDAQNEQRAEELLSHLETEHIAFSRSLESLGGAAAFSDTERQSPNGPYRPLALLLANYLEAWVRANIFDDELTELTGLVVAEHHLAMEGFTATLGYPRVNTGAVVQWLRRLRAGEQVLSNLENAILGRFRRLT